MVKPNAQRLYKLTELREARQLTLADMAEYCGLHTRRGRESVGKWEQGLSVPFAKRRTQFLKYLKEGLKLHGAELAALWEIMVEEWGWDPLSDQEYQWRNAKTIDEQSSAPIQSQANPEQPRPDQVNLAQANPDGDEAALLLDKPDQWRFALPTDDLPEPGPLPRGSKIPFGRNPLFVGRKRELMNLATMLNAQNTAAISQVEIAAATGLGGIGKTQLASEFLHRYGQFFPGGVFWLSFDSERAIPATIAACGDTDALNLRADFALRPLEEQVRLVRAAWQEPIPRLIIFDNCENPALLTQWRPLYGGCRILITSRRGEWERILGVRMLPLDVLDRAESILLLQRLAPHADSAILDQIAEELGDLPLALHLAGSYIDHYQLALGPALYLEQLRNPDLLSHPSFLGHGHSPTGHIQHVGRTFALSYDQLDKNDPTDLLAHSLLVCMAHFAPGEPVWYELLERMVNGSRSDVDAALQVADGLARLIELGLVNVERVRLIRMHRLVAAFVQQVAKDQMRETQQLVEQVLFDEMAHANHLGYPMPLLARQAHLRSVVDLAQQREDEIGADLCLELSSYLWHVSEFEDARRYCEKALAIRLAHFGEEHTATAECLNMMGKILRELGEAREARQFFERALAIRERKLGVGHLHVAETLNNLGWLLWYERQQHPTREYLERALAIADQVLGRGHRFTAECANNLGLCLQDCFADPQGALRYFELALQIRKQILGAEHLLTVNSLNNMGYVHHALGNLREAQTYYEETLALRRKFWQGDHPDIAVSLKNLGTVLQNQGQFAQARNLLEQALKIYIRSLGEVNSRTSFCLDSLGLLLQEQGELALARHYLERALAVRRKTYRANHLNVAISLEHLAKVLLAQDEISAARSHLQEALSIRRQVLDDEDPRIVAIAALLAALEEKD